MEVSVICRPSSNLRASAKGTTPFQGNENPHILGIFLHVMDVQVVQKHLSADQHPPEQHGKDKKREQGHENTYKQILSNTQTITTTRRIVSSHIL